jgi:hypothetical protein
MFFLKIVEQPAEPSKIEPANPSMKRRTFVKKSVAASILTPLALTGLINASGATETGNATATGGTTETGGTTQTYTTVPETWSTTEGTTTTIKHCASRSTDVVPNYKREVEIIKNGVTVKVMCCFTVFDCYDGSGQPVGSYRTMYVEYGTLNQQFCAAAQNCPPTSGFYNLDECSAPLPQR